MNRATVMLLIDGDNVSLDVMEQAIPWVHKHYGGPHLCRAYCTPESAVRHQLAFKRLGIRPMVNLAAGKNSTDIALAVDAIDLAFTDQPAVMVIASSDSDFAPLVMRLREKGCRVIGVGQQGKTGQETQSMYDDFEVLVHQRRGAAVVTVRGESGLPDMAMDASGEASVSTAAAPTRRAASPRRAPRASSEAGPSQQTPSKRTRRASTSSALSTAPSPSPFSFSPPAPSPVAGPTARDDDVSPNASAAAKPTLTRRRARKTSAPVARPAPAPAPARALGDEAAAMMHALPELARGGEMALNVAAERLRHAKLLSNRGSSTKLFAHYPELFELVPQGRPSRVKAK